MIDRTGSIPSAIGSLTALNYFNAQSNNLNGELLSISSSSNKIMLNMCDYIKGTIPISLGLLKNLEALEISENCLSGNIFSFICFNSLL